MHQDYSQSIMLLASPVFLLPMTTKLNDSFSAMRFWYSETTSILLPNLVEAFEGVEIPEGGIDSTGEDIPDRSDAALSRGAVVVAIEDEVEFLAVEVDFVVVFVDVPKFMADMSNCNCPSDVSSSSRNSTISSS